MSAIFQAVIDLATEYGFYGPIDIWRGSALASGKRGVPALHQSGLNMAIILPMREPDRRLMQQIGGERSSRMGYAAAGSDVIDGDEVHQGTGIYVIDGAESTPHMVFCALSKVLP